MTAASLRRPRRASEGQRPFSLPVYLLIVVTLSWPFQIAYVSWGFDKTQTPFMSYSLSSLSMVMVAVGTFIGGRYVFRDGFADAGWSWGKPRHYLAVFGLVVFVWVLPTVLEVALGMRSMPAGVIVTEVLGVFLLRFVATLIPAFGEEFGWRGYICCPGLRSATLSAGRCWCTPSCGGRGTCQRWSASAHAPRASEDPFSASQSCCSSA